MAAAFKKTVKAHVGSEMMELIAGAAVSNQSLKLQ